MYITSTSGYHASKPCVAQITKKKNRLKVYPSTKDQVYLNDGDEFEIELFNPKTSPVLAKISINGKRISERGIILNPGQRIFLERFLDSPEKFKFSTYKVNNSQEVREAIAENGLIKIDFYEEYNSASTSGITWTKYTNWPIFGSTTGGYFSTTGGSTTTTTNTFYNSSLTYTSSVAGSFDVSNSSDVSRNINKRADHIETGRVESGSNSDQDFQNANGNFNSWPCNIVEYQILPIAQKHIETKEIRTYCTECGTRNKQDWKFCPTCGKKF